MQEQNTPKRKTKTSSAVKERYNEKTYRRYQFRVRYDDPAQKNLEAYEGSVNELILRLLREYFAHKIKKATHSPTNPARTVAQESVQTEPQYEQTRLF
jgi:hypothetical protein